MMQDRAFELEAIPQRHRLNKCQLRPVGTTVDRRRFEIRPRMFQASATA